jgi:hypothetical protein
LARHGWNVAIRQDLTAFTASCYSQIRFYATKKRIGLKIEVVISCLPVFLTTSSKLINSLGIASIRTTGDGKPMEEVSHFIF